MLHGNGKLLNSTGDWTFSIRNSTANIGVSAACANGGTYTTASSATITTDNYPSFYPKSSCTWSLAVSTGSVVLLKFNSFNIMEVGNCAFENVIIRDGNTTGTVLGQFCGTILPPAFLSTSNTMTVVLATFGFSNTQYTGFSATFSEESPSSGLDSGCYNLASWTGTATGSIASMYYGSSDPYEDNAYCKWEITVTPGKYVNLTFHREFEVDIFCIEADRVKVYSGVSTGLTELGSFCGYTLPSALQSCSNKMTVEFTTDSANGHGPNLPCRDCVDDVNCSCCHDVSFNYTTSGHYTCTDGVYNSYTKSGHHTCTDGVCSNYTKSGHYAYTGVVCCNYNECGHYTCTDGVCSNYTTAGHYTYTGGVCSNYTTSGHYTCTDGVYNSYTESGHYTCTDGVYNSYTESGHYTYRGGVCNNYTESGHYTCPDGVCSNYTECSHYTCPDGVYNNFTECGHYTCTDGVCSNYTDSGHYTYTDNASADTISYTFISICECNICNRSTKDPEKNVVQLWVIGSVVGSGMAAIVADRGESAKISPRSPCERDESAMGDMSAVTSATVLNR
ncbi:hypothetical protein Bbelb_085760 [Branchiostoma belcheri]|nr:hypothetical protein Bbelb_085760 [Branchiostoma belcheri]